jgi:hypothetical protein
MIALLLQSDPQLTPDSVKILLARGAVTDSFTGSSENDLRNRWGAGKANVANSLAALSDPEFTVPTVANAPLQHLPAPRVTVWGSLLEVHAARRGRLNLYGLNGRLIYSAAIKQGETRIELPYRLPQLTLGSVTTAQGTSRFVLNSTR